MRVLSLSFRTAFNAPQTGEEPIYLVTITHEDMPGIIRLSSDPTTQIDDAPLIYGTISGGNTYLFIGPFSLILPDEGEDKPPRMRMQIANIDRSMVKTVRSTSTPAQVVVNIVALANVNLVEVPYPAFDLLNCTYDAGALSFDLGIDAMVTEPFPGGSMDTASFRGLF